jgi:hypothetical protein
MFIHRFWDGTLSSRCHLGVDRPVIRLPFRLFPLVSGHPWRCSKLAHAGSLVAVGGLELTAYGELEGF